LIFNRVGFLARKMPAHILPLLRALLLEFETRVVIVRIHRKERGAGNTRGRSEFLGWSFVIFNSTPR
jgi:hypothetical protein